LPLVPYYSSVITLVIPEGTQHDVAKMEDTLNLFCRMAQR